MLLPLPGCGKQAAEAFDAGQAMAPVTEAPVTPGPTAYAVPITMAPTATPSPTPTFTPEPTPEPTATPKPTPSPTPTSVPMDRRDFEAEVPEVVEPSGNEPPRRAGGAGLFGDVCRSGLEALEHAARRELAAAGKNRFGFFGRKKA